MNYAAHCALFRGEFSLEECFIGGFCASSSRGRPRHNTAVAFGFEEERWAAGVSCVEVRYSSFS